MAVVNERLIRTETMRSGGSEGGVLRAERHAAEGAFDTTRRLRFPGQQQEMARAGLAQATGRQQSPYRAGAKQDGVAVEFASRNGETRQRIERIMLDDADEASGES